MARNEKVFIDLWYFLHYWKPLEYKFHSTFSSYWKNTFQYLRDFDPRFLVVSNKLSQIWNEVNLIYNYISILDQIPNKNPFNTQKLRWLHKGNIVRKR